MYQENIVLCGASSYEQKYYFNPDFNSLPESIKQESLHWNLMRMEICSSRQKHWMQMPCMMRSEVC